MPDTIITPDGRMHTLLGSTTVESIIREYAGEEPARAYEALLTRDAYAEAQANTDLGVYEAELDHWRRMAADWVSDISGLIHQLSGSHGITKAGAVSELEKLRRRIEEEL